MRPNYGLKLESENEELVKEGEHAIKQGKWHEHSSQVGVYFLVQEAMVNGTEYVMHPTSGV